MGYTECNGGVDAFVAQGELWGRLREANSGQYRFVFSLIFYGNSIKLKKTVKLPISFHN